MNPSVDAIRIPFTIAAHGANLARFVYAFVVRGSSVVLIDSGVMGSEREILAQVGAGQRRADEVAWLLLTHSHPDHVGGARAVRQACGCRVAVHAAERRWVEDVATQARERAVPGFDRLVGGSVPVDRALADGDVIEIGPGQSIRVIHTPGHSAGSVSFLLEPGGDLFTGDAVPVPGDMPIYDDPQASLRSLDKLRQTSFERLLASWDVPRGREEARPRIEQAMRWLERIGDAVQRVARGASGVDPAALTREVIALLGLPAIAAANPLVARTFMSHLARPEGGPR